jgi:hypothetical protein
MVVPMADSESFSTRLEVQVLMRPADGSADWQEVDRGPGVFHIPTGQLVGIRIKGISDRELGELVSDLSGCQAVVMLHLAESRRITDRGLECLAQLPQLTYLNLGACDLTNDGILHLKPLIHLETLDLSYCNRLTDQALRYLKPLSQLKKLNLQGCVKITTAGLAFLRRSSLEIHK